MKHVRIALISMPWASPYRPSIQLGTLSSYLTEHVRCVEIETFNFFLKILDYINYTTVKKLSDGAISSFVTEAINSFFLYPSDRDRIFDYIEAEIKKSEPDLDIRRDILLPYEQFIADIASMPWRRFDAIGFSVSLCQTFSSLLAASKIKDRAPRALLLMGGPAVFGRVGRSLMMEFPAIDYVMSGEGEFAIASIAKLLKDGCRTLDSVPGVVSRQPHRPEPIEALQLDGLDVLPLPDYDQYFTDVRKYDGEGTLHRDIEIPIEGSRGCWWQSSSGPTHKSCRFCNLNAQWRGYREKSTSKVVAEVDTLGKRYHVRRILFVDNVLRRRGADDVFNGIAKLERDHRINLEARVSITSRLAKSMKECGVESVQLGIESLSTGELIRMGKGTTAMQNLAAMKCLERAGIANPANIMCSVPDAVASEVKETIDAVDYASAYYPLKPVPFILQYGSPYSATYEARGALQKNHASWAHVVPRESFERLFFSEREIESRLDNETAEAYEQLIEKLERWNADYHERKNRHGVKWLLRIVERGIGRLAVEDFRLATPIAYDLDEDETAVYEFFDSPRPVLDAHAVLTHIGQARIWSIIDSFRQHKLVYLENGLALSLAV